MGITGDANLNDVVDFNDFLVLQTHFGSTSATFSQGDFNYDGKVNFNDFLLLQTHFGTTLAGGPAAVTAEQIAAMTAFGSTNTVPEPATCALVVCAMSVLGSRPRDNRRRP